MSSNATTNEAINATSLPSTPKAQTAKEVIAAKHRFLASDSLRRRDRISPEIP